jgi:hypothetical protein
VFTKLAIESLLVNLDRVLTIVTSPGLEVEVVS